MSRRAKFPQSRRHVFVYDKDWAFLETHYGLQSPSKLGPGATIREIVHNYVERLRARTVQQLDTGGSSASPGAGVEEKQL